MTGILGRGSNAKQQNIAASLRFQTSQKGGTIPLVYGANRIAINLLDYQNLQSSSGQGKSGKGGVAATGSKSGQRTTYSVDFIAGLAQGPVEGFGLVWYNKTITTFLGASGLSFAAIGEDGQPTDSYWVGTYPNNAINYSGTAFFTGDGYDLGSNPTLPNFNVEVYGMAYASAPNGCDANPALIVADLLTNPRYGAQFPAARLDTLDDYKAYCDAAGLMLAPVYDQQQTAQQILAELAALTNSAIVWSGGVLKIVPFGDQPLSVTFTPISFSGALTPGDQLSLTVSGAFSGSPVTLNYYLTENDALSYAAVGAALARLVTGNSTPGTGMAATGIYATVTPYGLAIISTRGTVPVITASGGGMVVGVTRGPYGWTPNTTPIYSLSDDDFIIQTSSVGAARGVSSGGPALRLGAGLVTGGFSEDPVRITRSTPADAMNMVQLEISDRGASYETSITEAFDQGSIDLHGIRRDTSLKARAIVDPYFVASLVAQLVLQRQLLYRNNYYFRLGWKYILLEPMDLVQITDIRLGARALTVRITAIEEDDEGTLSITAEDWFGAPGPVLYPPAQPIVVFGGVTALGAAGATATPYAKQVGASEAAAPNYGKLAPPINRPFILEPTAALLAARGQTSPYIVIGLSGGPDGRYDPNWGGAEIYVSLDGTSFTEFGTFSGRSVMGYTISDCLSGDASLEVDLSESHGALSSVSAHLAAAAISLCAVRTPEGDLEFLSYTTASPSGANRYILAGLYRGLYDTYAIDLPAGSQFLLLGSTVFEEVLPAQFVGQTVRFEFPSFNITGAGKQSLSETTIYSYTPMGSSVIPGVFPTLVADKLRLLAEIGSGTTRGASDLRLEHGTVLISAAPAVRIETR